MSQILIKSATRSCLYGSVPAEPGHNLLQFQYVAQQIPPLSEKVAINIFRALTSNRAKLSSESKPTDHINEI